MRSVWLDGAAQGVMERDAIRWGAKETGGPLFGYENYGELVVTRAYLPGPKAWHFPWLYRPDRAAVQAAIDEVYEETGGQQRWVGSWHTHPLGRPLPSLVDRRTAERVAGEAAVACPEPLMLIQTTRMSRNGLQPRPLGAFRWTSEIGALRRVTVRIA